MTAATRWYVYVIRDVQGEALYVGSSGSVGHRLAQHHLKPWYEQAVAVTFDRYPTRDEALTAELTLINQLKPRHNIAGRADLPNDGGYETRRRHRLGLPCVSDACIAHGLAAQSSVTASLPQRRRRSA